MAVDRVNFARVLWQALMNLTRSGPFWMVPRMEPTNTFRKTPKKIAKLGQERFLRKAGACGVASAQLYWGGCLHCC